MLAEGPGTAVYRSLGEKPSTVDITKWKTRHPLGYHASTQIVDSQEVVLEDSDLELRDVTFILCYVYLGFRNVNELTITIYPDKYFNHFLSFLPLVLRIEPRCLFHDREVPCHWATPSPTDEYFSLSSKSRKNLSCSLRDQPEACEAVKLPEIMSLEDEGAQTWSETHLISQTA